jgi:Spy/CpxP family protein refolding chaperone
MNRWTMTLTALALFGATVWAQEQRRGPRPLGPMGGPPGPPPAIERALHLTEAQQQAWRQLHEDHFKTIQPLLDQERSLRKGIRKALDQGGADPASIGRDMIAAHAVELQIRQAHEELEKQLVALLDPDQKARYEKLREERGPRGPGPGGPGPDGPGPFPRRPGAPPRPDGSERY